MPSPDSRRRRRNDILRLLAGEAHSLFRLRERLRPQPSERTLRVDLAELRKGFPGRLTGERRGHALHWRFRGDVPQVLARPLLALDDDQIAAIIVARGLLRTSDPADTPVEQTDTRYQGPLAKALDRLLGDAGLEGEARAIAPEAVAISRFGAAPVDDRTFPAAFGAIRTGESVTFVYTNLGGVPHPVHGKAVRLVHIAGEWHLLAWAADQREPPGKLKQYRLSRMADVTRVAAIPPGCPRSGLRAEAADHLRDAFRATGSTQLGKRRRIVLACSAKAWPFIQDRRWGGDQRIDDAPVGLPPGWRRLSFGSSGLDEARHWVLGFGAEVRAEQPPELVAWVRDQAQAILATTAATANSAAAATGLRPKVRR